MSWPVDHKCYHYSSLGWIIPTHHGSHHYAKTWAKNMGKDWQKASLRSMPNFTNSFQEQNTSKEVIFINSEYFNAKRSPGVYFWKSVHTFPWLAFSKEGTRYNKNNNNNMKREIQLCFFHSFIHHCGHFSWQWHFKSCKKRPETRLTFRIFFFFNLNVVGLMFRGNIWSWSVHFFFSRTYTWNKFIIQKENIQYQNT